MARLTKGILGPGKGKIGNVVMYSRCGVDIIRSVPDKKPKKTPRRLAQRQKMSLVHEFLRPAKELIHKTFANDVPTRSPYQAAQSYHLKHAIAGEYPNQYIDLSKALISKGEVPLPDNINFSVSDIGISINWDKDEKPAIGKSSDALVIMWRYTNHSFVDHIQVGARRYHGTYLWDMITADHINNYTIWIAFRNKEETEFSNSYCLHIAE